MEAVEGNEVLSGVKDTFSGAFREGDAPRFGGPLEVAEEPRPGQDGGGGDRWVILCSDADVDVGGASLCHERLAQGIGACELIADDLLRWVFLEE